MALTDIEKQRVRWHLGYTSVSSAASMALGIPALRQTDYMVNRSMDMLLPVAEADLRRVIGIMDGIEDRMVRAATHVAAETLNGLKLRPDEFDQLCRQYRVWGERICDCLHVPPQLFSSRYQQNAGGGFRIVPTG